MRVRFGLGLPGPFVLTTSHRRGRFPIFTLFIMIALLLAAITTWPWESIGVGVVIVGAIFLVRYMRTKDTPTDRSR